MKEEVIIKFHLEQIGQLVVFRLFELNIDLDKISKNNTPLYKATDSSEINIRRLLSHRFDNECLSLYPEIDQVQYWRCGSIKEASLLFCRTERSLINFTKKQIQSNPTIKDLEELITEAISSYEEASSPEELNDVLYKLQKEYLNLTSNENIKLVHEGSVYTILMLE